MERQELEYKFEQLMRERHKWYFRYLCHHIMKLKMKDLNKNFKLKNHLFSFQIIFY